MFWQTQVSALQSAPRKVKKLKRLLRAADDALISMFPNTLTCIHVWVYADATCKYCEISYAQNQIHLGILKALGTGKIIYPEDK